MGIEVQGYGDVEIDQGRVGGGGVEVFAMNWLPNDVFPEWPIFLH
jgi:hypothetical protein